VFRAAIVYVFLYAAIATYAPFLQQYYLDQGIPVPLIGAMSAYTSSVGLVSSVVWGAIHDRLPGSRWLVPLAAGFATIGGLSMYFVGASPLIIPAAGLWAVGMVGTIPMMDVRVLSMVGANRTRYSWIRACGSVGFMVFAPVVGMIVDARGTASIFFLLAPAMVMAAVASTTVPGRPDSVRAASMRKAPGVVLRHRPIVLYLVGTLAAWIALQAQVVFISVYFEELGAPSSVVGWAWTVAAAMEVPIMFAFPWLARRFGLERLILVGATILVVRQLANVVFTSPLILLACSVLQGAGFALTLIGGIMFVSLQAPKGTAATAQGILNSIGSLATIIAGGLGGQLAGLVGLRGLFAAASAMGALAVVLYAIAVIPAARAGKLATHPAGLSTADSVEGVGAEPAIEGWAIDPSGVSAPSVVAPVTDPGA
jgi:MFS transporter, PPP family, 3-phenylpropionic acid transporter